MSKNLKKKLSVRRIVQIIFFVLITLISINKILMENGAAIPFISTASIHALCPYGGVESFWAFVTTGMMVKKVHESSFVLLGIVMVLAVLFGPVFCSYICPLGSIQEWIGKLGKKIFPKKFNSIINKKVDKWIRFIRYGILIWTVYLTTKSLKLVFEAYDPYYALFNFWKGEVAISALIVLALVLVLSLIVERPWCKYACPFGALLGLSNFIKIFKIRRNNQTCISCNKCTKACPMNIEVANKEKVINHQCISCGQCTSEQSCPVSNTAVFATNLKKRALTNKVVALIVVLIIVTGVGISKLTNTFKTESEKVPATFQSGDFKGEYNPADIRGSYKLIDISNSFDVSVETLAQAFNINTADNANFQIKELEAMYEDVGTSSVRKFVALYTGLPYEGEADALPNSAIEILFEHGKITQEAYETLMKSKVESTQEQKTIPATPSQEPIADEETHSTVNGSTTVTDALALGLELNAIETVLGCKVENESALIKDIAKENGKRFSEIKEQLNALIE